jgi:hypothetical protein
MIRWENALLEPNAPTHLPSVFWIPTAFFTGINHGYKQEKVDS